MQIAIVSTALGIVLFLCLFLGFKTGLRLGINTAKGEIPKTPVEAVQETIKKVREIKDESEQSEANKKFEADMDRFMSYTGDVEEEE